MLISVGTLCLNHWIPGEVEDVPKDPGGASEK